jgi:hypothetical protein
MRHHRASANHARSKKSSASQGSGKQKRIALTAKRTAKRETKMRANIAKQIARLHRELEAFLQEKERAGVRVNRAQLAPHRSDFWSTPFEAGYYIDREFQCVDCGKQEVWTGKQQKWWFEVAKGSVYSTARRCRPCRRKARLRKKAHQAHQAEATVKNKLKKLCAAGKLTAEREAKILAVARK